MNEKTKMYLEERNRKIIDAVIKKAETVCPGALALIGIYGSFMTGDFNEKSDLDLLILINDDRGWQLGCTFIQDDLQVGHDIYCTTWEDLQREAGYEHPNISKLMDSRIVYCADEKYKERLELLRKTAEDILSAPFSEEDYAKAEKMLKEAEHYYTSAMISENKSDVLNGAGGVIYYIENAIAMLNKQYFHYGVKRVYEELNAMCNRPEKLCDRIEDIISADSAADIQKHLSALMKETVAVFHKVKETISIQKKAVTGAAITGTFEEMYSNWRNKMYLAAESGNRHLAYMSLISLNSMFSEIYSEVDIEKYDVLKGYDSQDLYQTAKAYDDTLNEYLNEYRKAGIPVKRYSDIDDFVRDYCLLSETSKTFENDLLNNLNKLHTTESGIERIKRNMSLDTEDVVDWCKAKISSANAVMIRNGKNWYVNADSCIITVNAHSYTIITVHKEKK